MPAVFDATSTFDASFSTNVASTTETSEEQSWSNSISFSTPPGSSSKVEWVITQETYTGDYRCVARVACYPPAALRRAWPYPPRSTVRAHDVTAQHPSNPTAHLPTQSRSAEMLFSEYASLRCADGAKDYDGDLWFISAYHFLPYYGDNSNQCRGSYCEFGGPFDVST